MSMLLSLLAACHYVDVDPTKLLKSQVTIQIQREDGVVVSNFSDLIEDNYGWRPSVLTVDQPDLEINYPRGKEICKDPESLELMEVYPISFGIKTINISNDILQTDVLVRRLDEGGWYCGMQNHDNSKKFFEMSDEHEHQLVADQLSEHLVVHAYDNTSDNVLELPISNIEKFCGENPILEEGYSCSYRVDVVVPTPSLTNADQESSKSESSSQFSSSSSKTRGI